MSISENYNEIGLRINDAVTKSADPDKTVNIIAVSKTIPVDQMKEAFSLGLVHFGENKVQELSQKMSLMEESIQWHMIGHLQRNKVKYIVDKVSLIHSVDSNSLLQEINKRGVQIGKTIDCLIQVNVSGEVSKYGISPDALEEMIKQVENYEMIKVTGLMTMAPHYDNPEKARDCFKRLHDLFHNIKEIKRLRTEFTHLSMGMSNDYEIAVQEGSNMVRIGSALFGEGNNG